MAIGVLLVAIGVPSIRGMLAEQRLQESFKRFDRLAALARRDSITGQHECRLIWGRKEITLRRAESPDGTDAENAVEQLIFEGKATYRLHRTAALQKGAPDEWAFWSNGTCEPAQIAYNGPEGSWLVQYDPLTAHAILLKSEAR
jgi:hypothetical protein